MNVVFRSAKVGARCFAPERWRLQIAAAWWLVLAVHSTSQAEVKRVSVEPPQKEVWVGQKATFFVTLKGEGPYGGASSFSLPQVPKSIILKVGNPVVSSEEADDQTWFVQTHEFALFSQADGSISVPEFEVRFSNRDGFTGPEKTHVEQVPAFSVTVKRPAGSEPNTFLVTSDSVSVQEQWDPPAGQLKQGDVIHRTISQQAEQVSGMALAPPSVRVPEGIRIHVDDPVIEDKTERGDFTGSRIDRITYVLEKPGTLTLPAVKYVWWKPESGAFGSTTLPAATFEVAAIHSQPTESPTRPTRGRLLVWLAMLAGLVTLLVRQRARITRFAKTVWTKLNPPERQVARKFLRACRRNDPAAAESAWARWQTTQTQLKPVDPALANAITDLHRHLYGPNPRSQWDGTQLATAFNDHRSESQQQRELESSLPPLNPTEMPAGSVT